MIERIISIVEAAGGVLTSRSASSISCSNYLTFDRINVQMSKSKRRVFFSRFPKANGASAFGYFTVRISDHREVSCREASMFNFRIDREAAPQIAELKSMLELLQS